MPRPDSRATMTAFVIGVERLFTQGMTTLTVSPGTRLTASAPVSLLTMRFRPMNGRAIATRCVDSANTTSSALFFLSLRVPVCARNTRSSSSCPSSTPRIVMMCSSPGRRSPRSQTSGNFGSGIRDSTLNPNGYAIANSASLSAVSVPDVICTVRRILWPEIASSFASSATEMGAFAKVNMYSLFATKMAFEFATRYSSSSVLVARDPSLPTGTRLDRPERYALLRQIGDEIGGRTRPRRVFDEEIGKFEHCLIVVRDDYLECGRFASDHIDGTAHGYLDIARRSNRPAGADSEVIEKDGERSREEDTGAHQYPPKRFLAEHDDARGNRSRRGFLHVLFPIGLYAVVDGSDLMPRAHLQIRRDGARIHRLPQAPEAFAV